MKTFDKSSQIHHMSYSTGLNLNSPSEFTFENLRGKPIITDPNKQTSATFDYELADWLWYKVEGSPGKEISVYVDTNKNIGKLEVSKKEFKHIKKQFQIIESQIDPVTGNAFDLKVTKKEKFSSETDIRIFKGKNLKKEYGEGTTGVWDTEDMNLVYEDDGMKFIKETLSHEIGHIFGLDHPLDSLETRAYFSDTIMNCCEGFTDTLLTSGDLGLLSYGWLHTFPHMHQNQNFSTP